MKVYVDELPKMCIDCVCFNKVNGRCQLKHLYIDTDLEPIDCPLQSLSDHTKQVRKEVIDKIRKKAYVEEKTFCYDVFMPDCQERTRYNQKIYCISEDELNELQGE